MARGTRYEEFTPEPRKRTVQTLTCDICGTITDVEPMRRPEGWCSLQAATEGQSFAYDFCSWDCLLEYVYAHEKGPAFIEAWEESIEQLAERQAEAAMNRAEQEREE